MLDGEDLVVETAEQIVRRFAAWPTPGDEAARVNDRLWNELEAAGIVHAWAPESVGGSGGSLGLGFELARVAGSAALSTPLTECLLGAWLLAEAGIELPPGPLGVAPAQPRFEVSCDGGVLRGRTDRVPFGRRVDFLAVLVPGIEQSSVALVRQRSVTDIEPGWTLARDEADTLAFDGVVPEQIAVVPHDRALTSYLLMGCVVRSMQIAGALATLLDLTLEYATQRIAFGRPISQFQVIQHAIATLASEVAAATTSATSAAAAIDEAGAIDPSDDGLFLEATAAKIRSAEAAATACAIAHQVHGAIGVSAEHALHQFTLRALAWRNDFGDESYWAAELGRRVTGLGGGGLWPLLASR